MALIRDMDAVILDGLGGYSTRAEFIIDAIQERILELTIEAEEDAGRPPLRASTGTPPSVQRASVAAYSTPQVSRGSVVASEPEDNAPPTLMESTRLESVSKGYVIEPASACNRTPAGHLFGLHNRDYPSLWALNKLAVATQGGPIEVETFFRLVLSDAWEFGSRLLRLADGMGKRHSAMFPTNPQKSKAAEAAFRAFAVGEYRAPKEGEIATSGPLFAWKAAALAQNDGLVSIGMTASGWDLLDACAGIDVSQPHARAQADAFLSHLRIHAKEDFAGFAAVLQCIGPEGATRAEVLERLGSLKSHWSEAELSTNASGYVARCREWGLVEPKQLKGQYLLTGHGRSFTQSLPSGGKA